MLTFSQRGEGETVVFLHGFLESSAMWNGLNFPFHCVFIDLPGHGNSELLSEVHPSMQLFADKVIEVLDHLECFKYALVGHSMGGYVGLEILKRTKNIHKLILLNSNFWEDSPQKKIDRSRIVEIVSSNKDWFIKEAIPNLFYKPNEYQTLIDSICDEASLMSSEAIQFATIAMRDRECSKDILKEHSLKIKILQGEYDTVVPLETMLSKLDDQSQLVVFPNSAHMSHAEVPELVLYEIVSFLNEK